MAENQDRETYWRSHWLSWRSSGETQRRYCEMRGLSFYEFAKWRTRLKDSLRAERQGARGFVPVVLRPMRSPSDEASAGVITPETASPAAVPTKRQDESFTIELRLCKGRSVVISGKFDSAVLREIIGVLETC